MFKVKSQEVIKVTEGYQRLPKEINLNPLSIRGYQKVTKVTELLVSSYIYSYVVVRP